MSHRRKETFVRNSRRLNIDKDCAPQHNLSQQSATYVVEHYSMKSTNMGEQNWTL